MANRATDGGLNDAQRTTLKKMLMDARAALQARRTDDLRTPSDREDVGDEGDEASRASNESTLLARAEINYARLAEIERALAKFETGEYGLDEETGEPIDVNRLMALPWARYAAATQEKLDRER